MSLENLLSTLHTDTHSRITRTSKQRIQEHIESVRVYEFSVDSAFSAAKAEAALRRRHNRGLSGYETMANAIGAKAAFCLEPKSHSLSAYETLTQSRAHYTTRFEEIREHLSSGLHYRDAVHCLDEIRTNNYLKRKARKDKSFFDTRENMIHELEEYVFSCEQHFREQKRTSLATKTKRLGYAALAAGWGAAVAYATSLF